MKAHETDWALIFDNEFVSRERCWETCGGGYCCKPTRAQRHYSFLRKEGVELPLLPGEYHYLRDNRLLQKGFSETLSRHEIKLSEGRSFPVYRTVCQLDGICSDHRYRPVVCRIYPFCPVPDVEGKLVRLEPTALIDLYWAHRPEGRSPCGIHELLPTEREVYERLALELFKDPVNIFYLKAASIYKKTLLEAVLDRYPQILRLPEGEFFAAWEKLLVLGRLYKPGEIQSRLDELYIDIKQLWKDYFFIEGL